MSIFRCGFEYNDDPCVNCGNLIPEGWATKYKPKGKECIWVCMGCSTTLKKHRKIEIIEEKIKKYSLTDRHRFINEGTVLIDDKFYYYIQSHKVRVKKKKIYYNCNFDKFVKIFLKE